MATSAHTVEIARPVEEVFAFSEPANLPHWQRSLLAVQPQRRGTFELEPAGGRLTRSTWTVETRGAAARLAGPLAARLTREELAANTLRLKHLLEENRAG